MSDNVHPLPERKDLPPEIAALAVEAEDPDEPATVVLNANEENLGTVYKEIRPGVLIPVLLGWAAEWTREAVHEHPAITVAVTSTVSIAALAAAVQLAPDGDDRPPPQPQSSIVSVLPTSPSHRTTPPTPSPASPAPASPSMWTPSLARTPSSGPERDKGSGGAPSARSTTRPTPQPTSAEPTSTEPTPSVSTPPPHQAPTPPPSDDAPAPEAGAAADPPTSTPSQTQAPAPSTTARDCAVRVDLPPLLNVCVLS